MDIKITQAQKDDWKLIQELNNEVFQNDKGHDDDLDLSWPYTDTGIKYYKDLVSGEYGHCLIAYENDKAVGYVALATKNFGYRKSKYIEIENIGVIPEYRSKGIGKILLDAAVNWAKEKNATKLFVSTYWKNKKAIKFYKKVGFSEIGLNLDMSID